LIGKVERLRLAAERKVAAGRAKNEIFLQVGLLLHEGRKNSTGLGKPVHSGKGGEESYPGGKERRGPTG